MGMAASQGRLLGLTARLSDVEFMSQQKCQSKIKLAMSTEAITAVYTEALNKTKFVGLTGFNNGSSVYSDLTYDMLTGANSPLAGEYCLTDSSNKVVVTQAMKAAFEGKSENQFLASFGVSAGHPSLPAVPASADYKPAVPASANYKPAVPASADYQPAVTQSSDYKPAYMGPPYQGTQAELDTARASALGDSDRATTLYQFLLTGKTPVTIVHTTTNPDGTTTSTNEQSFWYLATPATPEQIAAAKADADMFKQVYDVMPLTIDGYVAQVGTASSPQVGTPGSAQVGTPGTAQVGTPSSPALTAAPPSGNASYYTNMYNRMSEGYTTLSDEANTVNSKEWLTNQLKNGGLYLEKFGTDGKTKDQNIVSASEISEVRDNKDVDIITAKYNSDLQKIQTKDKRLDMEIKQLDTEHSALQTEVDSVKKVITKNIESSFKTFG